MSEVLNTPDHAPDREREAMREVIAEWHYETHMEYTDCPWGKLSDEHRERHRRWYADPCIATLSDAGLLAAPGSDDDQWPVSMASIRQAIGWTKWVDTAKYPWEEEDERAAAELLSAIAAAEGE